MTRPRKSWAAWVAMAALAAATVASLRPEISQAHVVRAPSEVSINYGYRRQRFYGQVRSRAFVCRRYRQIVVIKARRGISDLIVARPRAGPRGRWRVRSPQAQGRYYAKVTRKIRTPYGHVHRCGGATSRVISVR